MQELSNERVRRTPEEWQESVERLSTTGLSQREFCRRERINVESFHRWYRRLTAPAQPGSSPNCMHFPVVPTFAANPPFVPMGMSPPGPKELP